MVVAASLFALVAIQVRQEQLCSLESFEMRVPPQPILKSLIAALLAWSATVLPLDAQSNRSIVVASSGAWHLRTRIPLGGEQLLLRPSNRVIQMLACAESPEFSGWTLTVQNEKPVLLDSHGRHVKNLPRSLTFRVTANALDRFIDRSPIPVNYLGSLNNFLLDLHFTLQIFRGMEMRTLQPKRAWLIGAPADEAAEERIYRASFDVGDLRPDDRVVLIVTDQKGERLTKFHLEFL